jgi:hypothetical protein
MIASLCRHIVGTESASSKDMASQQAAKEKPSKQQREAKTTKDKKF